MSIDPAAHKQLFLDDHAVHSTTGVTRTLHPPEKHGPLIAADNSLGQENVQSRSAPQWNSEEGIWEWWYFSSCPEVSGGKGTLTNYATSTSRYSDDCITRSFQNCLHRLFCRSQRGHAARGPC